MSETNIANLSRSEVRAKFDSWIEGARARGLVDIKFCVENGGVTEDALRQFLHIQQMEAEGKTTPFADY